MKKYSKGEIYYAYLNPVVGSEEGGLRPVLILQDNKALDNANTVLIAPLTRVVNKKYKLCSHVYINPRHYLKHNSVILLEHTRSISKERLRQYIAKITFEEQKLVNRAILNTFNLNDKEINVNEK